jgi:EAL domain-containing protein (putative c-di-GMP-specific phosphodiesterase class I)
MPMLNRLHLQEPRSRPLSSGEEEVLLELLDARRFGTQYEPIVEASTGRTVAHEALARFATPDGAALPPGHVMAWLHRIPGLLFETELALKALQLEHAPAGELFLNVDPDGYASSPGPGTPFRSLLSSAPGRVVVEAIENLDRPQALRADAMVADLRRAGIRVALDDLGAEHGVHSFDALVSADFFKFDRSLVRGVREPRRRELVCALIGMARRCGVRTVLEGIETSADLAVAGELGVDLVQGFLFRDRFLVVAGNDMHCA